MAKGSLQNPTREVFFFLEIPPSTFNNKVIMNSVLDSRSSLMSSLLKKAPCWICLCFHGSLYAKRNLRQGNINWTVLIIFTLFFRLHELTVKILHLVHRADHHFVTLHQSTLFPFIVKTFQPWFIFLLFHSDEFRPGFVLFRFFNNVAFIGLNVCTI